MSKPGKRYYLLLLVILLLGVILVNPGLNQCYAAKVDLYDVIGETQQTYSEEGRNILVWWLAEPYWKAIVSRSKLSAGDAELVLASIKPYIILAISNFKKNDDGTLTYLNQEQLYSITKAEFGGVIYFPIHKKDMNTLAFKLVQESDAGLSEMVDPKWGELHMLVFKPGDDQPNINPTKPGTLSVSIGKHSVIWRLPLSSAVPPQICPKCGVSLNGGFNFCPWDGTVLKSSSNSPKTPPTSKVK